MKKAYYVLMGAIALYLLSPIGGTWFYQHNIRGFYVLLLGFILANLFTPIAVKLALKFKILDYPDRKRKIHKKPIPRLGGLAVFGAFILVILRNQHFPDYVVGILIACTVLFVFEIIDDIKPTSAFLRLFGQVLAAGIIVFFGVTISIVPHMPGQKIIEVLLTIFWIVGITNAFNFLDGVDGLATGLAIISALCFYVLAWPLKEIESGYIQIAVMGVCAGFLPYNWKPAKIFLGDSGATLIGFLLSVLAIVGTLGTSNPVKAGIIPLLIMSIPIFDMIYITISRIKNGVVRTVREWIEYTGKDHFHHRLLNMGLTERMSVIFLCALNLSFGLGAIVLKDAVSLDAVLLLLQGLIIFGIIVILMITGRELS